MKETFLLERFARKQGFKNWRAYEEEYESMGSDHILFQLKALAKLAEKETKKERSRVLDEQGIIHGKNAKEFWRQLEKNNEKAGIR